MGRGGSLELENKLTYINQWLGANNFINLDWPWPLLSYTRSR